jgi:uncharacterized MAPEG superfamily protein
MTFAYWCILLAALAPYLTIAASKVRPDFDNNRPREWEERLDGWRKRLYWAHLNAFEAFAPFAAGVIVAHLAHAPQGRIDLLAGIFIAARIAYPLCYYADQAGARSIAWVVGFLSVIGLFVVAGLA